MAQSAPWDLRAAAAAGSSGLSGQPPASNNHSGNNQQGNKGNNNKSPQQKPRSNNRGVTYPLTMRQMNHIASSLAHMQAWGEGAGWWQPQGKGSKKGKGKGKGEFYHKGKGPWMQPPTDSPPINPAPKSSTTSDHNDQPSSHRSEKMASRP